MSKFITTSLSCVRPTLYHYRFYLRVWVQTDPSVSYVSVARIVILCSDASGISILHAEIRPTLWQISTVIQQSRNTTSLETPW